MTAAGSPEGPGSPAPACSRPGSAPPSATIPAWSIVVVCFPGEFNLLRLLLRSLSKHLDPTDLDTILVLWNTDPGDDTSIDRYRPGLISALDAGRQLSPRLQLVPATPFLTPSERGMPGWSRQQILKLKAAETVPSPAYVVLDAKNIVLAPVSRQTFFAPDGRAFSKRVDASRPGKFTDFLQTALDLFGADTDQLAPERSLPTVTPATLFVDVVTAMRAELLRRHHETPATYINRPNPRTSEFLLYAGYCAAHGLIEDRYRFSHHVSSATLYTVGPDTRAGLDKALARMSAQKTIFIGVHRRRWPRLADADRERLGNLLIDRGIFDNRTQLMHEFGYAPDRSPEV
ncbi:DUF6492 family protein [Naumannella halotolerans]|uniref:Uncharacterized protein n=1 Tax=Naumannella halotolerans TaxID=993414 RepID=A0A4R7J0P9_9ACTN|nr:DUF6492 family protein [Naumannella halotolerans]TDT29956.1 hypothetical protein CLV29_2979 [Naumannella halotolerans]